jgi:hypothetical protein
VSTLLLPSSELIGGVTLLDRASVDENTGVYAVRLWPTCAAWTSVPSRTTARSGLWSMARRTASSSVRANEGAAGGWAMSIAPAVCPAARPAANPSASVNQAIVVLFITMPPPGREP